MTRMLIGVVLAWNLVQAASGADRLAEVEQLVAEYDKAAESFFAAPIAEEPTTDQRIRRYEAWPGWEYIPRFLALAEAMPEDEAAFRCCQWIIVRRSNVGNEDTPIYDADQRAWQILAKHHTGRKDLPMLCLRAVWYRGPAQEEFLRGLIARKDLSHEYMGFATVALAELLAHKHDHVEHVPAKPDQPQDEFSQYLKRRKAPQWGKELIAANGPRFKAESIRLFRETLTHYAQIPITISAPYFRDFKSLGDKARASLHALEHLTVGAQAPEIRGNDLNGKSLELSDSRGSVVLLTFWSTGCGPCLAAIPEEQKLLKTYQGRAFTILAVCRDEHIEVGRKTVTEHGIEWACWFDGADGPIARDYNVLALPTTYLLDKRGKIVAKNPDGQELQQKIAKLLDMKQ